jgi:hypothetical protein
MLIKPPLDLPLNMTVPTYRYHVLNRQGLRVESNLPDPATAEACVSHLATLEPHEAFTIEQEQIYTVQGLGRDPDLH